LLSRVGETNRRATCANNLRRIGQAIAMYHDVQDRRFPQATLNDFTALNVLAPWTAVPCADRLSWMAGLLPYLEPPDAPRTPRSRRQASTWEGLYQRLNPRRPWDEGDNAAVAAVTVHPYLCPSRSGPDDPTPAQTNYPGIAGVGPGAADLPEGDPRAGFFGYERLLRTGAGVLLDPLPAGTSHTLAAAETAWRPGPWAAGGFSSVRPVDPALAPLVGVDRPFGGLHPGGANLLMLDGRVQFFSDQGNPAILARLATLAEDL
jgi:prepilin-type processing-associated H-X9-DG protein